VREIIDVGGTDLYGGSPRARGTAQCLHREPRLPRAEMPPGAEARRQKILPPWSPRTPVQALQTRLAQQLKIESEEGATRTANEFNLLYFTLIRLLFHVLSAFRKPVHLCGMRFPTLVDLCDGARVEIGDGL
jgi:hypothetical protein